MKTNIKKLRKTCLKLRGKRPQQSLNILAQKISTENDIVNPNSLSMALTGLRECKRSEDLLQRLFAFLQDA
jgi:hypothetical protein